MFTYSLLLAFASLLLVSAQKAGEGYYCDIKMDDLNATAVYLRPTATRFIYPTTSEGFKFGRDSPMFRIVCPGGTVTARDMITTYRSVLVECVGGKSVKITDTLIYAPLKDIGCTGTARPVSRLTGRVNPVGKKIAEIGYELGVLQFLPVIDEVCVSNRSSGYIPRWVHHKLPNMLNTKTPGEPKSPVLKNGPISGKLNYTDVYNLDTQMKLFLTLFKDEKLVKKYVPEDGSQMFVPGQLVSAEDMFWELEKNATLFYETSAPMWSSVRSGNWKMVGDVVRRIASQSLSEIEVWSGVYLKLYLPDVCGKNVYVTLSQNVWPSQFLYKYVLDKSNKRGLVFVTVNNPHITEATPNNVICNKLAICEKEYPEFNDFSKGYTYCCNLADFERHALKMGLPTFTEEYQNVEPASLF